jgi:hypothetical protein
MVYVCDFRKLAEKYSSYNVRVETDFPQDKEEPNMLERLAIIESAKRIFHKNEGDIKKTDEEGREYTLALGMSEKKLFYEQIHILKAIRKNPSLYAVKKDLLSRIRFRK